MKMLPLIIIATAIGGVEAAPIAVVSCNGLANAADADVRQAEISMKPSVLYREALDAVSSFKRHKCDSEFTEANEVARSAEVTALRELNVCARPWAISAEAVLTHGYPGPAATDFLVAATIDPFEEEYRADTNAIFFLLGPRSYQTLLREGRVFFLPDHDLSYTFRSRLFYFDGGGDLREPRYRFEHLAQQRCPTDLDRKLRLHRE